MLRKRNGRVGNPWNLPSGINDIDTNDSRQRVCIDFHNIYPHISWLDHIRKRTTDTNPRISQLQPFFASKTSVSSYHSAASKSMPTFSSFPTELIQEMASYLAPFDQIALSASSKFFYTITKQRKPVDDISRQIYLSCNLTRTQFPTSHFFRHPTEIIDLLTYTCDLVFSNKKRHNLSRRLALARTLGYWYKRRHDYSQPVQHRLLEPYFAGTRFPQSSVAYHYWSAIQTFAERAGRYAFEQRLTWGVIENFAANALRALLATQARVTKEGNEEMPTAVEGSARR